ncbi:MAG: BspA family leucine-rich repeat surface protein, partial [Elusimicrobia bacterium]|nr:BspA family leucine-rich repeat surface protein [Elusimicrobiota bacterium]
MSHCFVKFFLRNHLGIFFINCRCKFKNSVYSLSCFGRNKYNVRPIQKFQFFFQLLLKLLELDVSKFDTKKVKNMNAMFCYNNHLTKLDVSHFDTT